MSWSVSTQGENALALPLILQIGDAVGVTSDPQRTIHRHGLAVLQRISAGA
jgi:hypothetical protein